MNYGERQLEERLQSYLEAHFVTGASIALIRNGSIEVVAIGRRDIKTN